MSNLPSRQQQIIQAHAGLIVAVADAAQHGKVSADLNEALQQTEQNGWTTLVNTIRKILAGSREHSLLAGLDEEDSAIIDAIMRGIQNPASLPDPNAQSDPALAAPGLANMIHTAASGNPEALQLLANMAEQMTQVGGDMGQLGGLMRRLVNGERDADKLGKKLNAQGQSLLHSILEELGNLEAH